MQPRVKLKQRSPIKELVDLTKGFNGDGSRAPTFNSQIEGVPSLDATDCETIFIAKMAIEKSLEEGNYEMAKLAYQVLDCTLRHAIEPAAGVISEYDQDQAFWISNTGNVVTLAQCAEIANVMRDVRTQAKFGVPDDLDDDVCEAVRAYVGNSLG